MLNLVPVLCAGAALSFSHKPGGRCIESSPGLSGGPVCPASPQPPQSTPGPDPPGQSHVCVPHHAAPLQDVAAGGLSQHTLLCDSGCSLLDRGCMNRKGTFPYNCFLSLPPAVVTYQHAYKTGASGCHANARLAFWSDQFDWLHTNAQMLQRTAVLSPMPCLQLNPPCCIKLCCVYGRCGWRSLHC